MYHIYELIDPRTTTAVYIGITRNTKDRYSAHMSCADRNEHKNAWIQGLKSEKLRPTMRVIDTAVDRAEAEKKEARLIKDYIERGTILVNIKHVTKKRSETVTTKRTTKRRSETVKRIAPCINDERERECFQQLDFEWSIIIDLNKPLTSIDLSLMFHRYTGSLQRRFSCLQDLIPLWISRKKQEIDTEVRLLKQGEECPLSWWHCKDIDIPSRKFLEERYQASRHG